MARRSAAGKPDETVPIAISSEYPVERYDWWEGERYLEVLDHSPSSVDLSRAQDGMPFVVSHQSDDARQQIGIVENVRVDKDRVLRGDVRFSSSADAQQFKRDMVDGIRKQISVGYIPDMNNTVRSQADGEALPTERCMRWQPLEASTVPIPADPTVGVGRSGTTALHLIARGMRDPKFAKQLRRLLRAQRAGESGADPTPAARKAMETAMPGTNGTAAQPAAPAVSATAGEDLAREQKRTEQIRALGKMFKLDETRVNELIATGMEARDVGTLIVAEAQSKLRAMNSTIEMSPNDTRHYSLSRAILGQLAGMKGTDVGPIDDGFEREVSQELAKNLPQEYRSKGGLLVPTRVKVGDQLLTKRTYIDTSASGPNGASLIFTQPGEFIDFLWPRMKVAKLGATRLSGLQGPVAFPKLTTPSSWTWTGDNPGSDVSESDPVFGQVALNPKEGQSTSGFTRSALQQAASGNVDLEAKVQNILFMAAALGIDLAAINGAGGNAPQGIIGTAGIGSVAGGTNGAVPTRQNMIDLQTAVANANADIGPGAYLTTPGVRGTLRNIFAAVSGTPLGLPVWSDDNKIVGEPAEVSTQVPSNLTKGTSSGICHAVIYGIWMTLNIGYWGAYELVVDPYTKKKQGVIEVTNYQIVGVALEYASAFACMLDALVN
jgi:HK97 family phage major capsid protein